MNIFKKILLFVTILFLFLGCESKTNNMKTVAFVSLSKVDDKTFEGFKNKMENLNWKENTNITYIVPGAAKQISNLPSIIEAVIKQKPDLILVSSTPATQEIKRQTLNSNIPVVFCPVSDPVNANILKNTKKPEGNITGVRLPVGNIKSTEWLYKLVPNLKTVFVPYTPNYNSSEVAMQDIKEVAKKLNFKVITKALHNPDKIEEFINSIPSNIDAIILPRDSLIESKIDYFSKYAIENKLPLGVPSYQQVEKGALYTFGFIHKELGKDAAKIADKILKGVKVIDLPVKFGNAYLVINESTAKKIGLEITNDVRRNAKLIIKE